MSKKTGDSKADHTAAGKFAPGNAASRGGTGRPRGATVTSELRRQGDPTLIARRLVEIIEDPKTPRDILIKAIKLYQDRTEGRAVSRSVSLTAEAREALGPAFFGLGPAERERHIGVIRRHALASAATPDADTGTDEDPGDDE
jgi:hypothetical protein